MDQFLFEQYYSKNGNIQGLNRTDGDGALSASYSYHYQAGTNKLLQVKNAGSDFVSYGYNATGQMIQQTEGAKSLKVTYNVFGLVKEIRDAGNKLQQEYHYDDKGDLLKKIEYKNNNPVFASWYIKDAAGNVMSTYEQNLAPVGPLVLVEVPIYGSGRVGIYKPQQNTFFYEINDHLGNVRAVLGQPEVVSYVATFENVSVDQGKFKNINPTYLATSAAANQTPGGNKAIRMNQSYKIGPSKSLKVYAGDIVDLDVYAYYESAVGYGISNASLSTMVGAVALPFGGVSGGAGEAGMIYDGVQSALTIFGLGGNRGDTKPAAYLNYILFDENYGYIDAGWKPVAELAPFTKGRLFFNPLNITTSGHLFVYLSYENQSNNYVHFDELRIRHEHSAVVHGQDYYAFGLPMEGRGIKREKYRYGFQGQYAEKDSLTGWNEFKLRMYDARIGRFTSVDPYGQFASPYLGWAICPMWAPTRMEDGVVTRFQTRSPMWA